MNQHTILFFCTGNYYRSRFSEIYYNYLAEKNGLDSRAFSKGLRLWEGNEGPISRHTKKYFEALEIAYDTSKWPESIAEEDFKTAHLIVGMDEEEHAPMIDELFPAYKKDIIFWSFADDYITNPDIILPALKLQVEQFIAKIKITI